MWDAFQVFVEWYSAYGYLVLFFGVLSENMGLPVPGEAALLVASFMASPEGGAHFHLGVRPRIADTSNAREGCANGFWHSPGTRYRAERAEFCQNRLAHPS